MKQAESAMTKGGEILIVVMQPWFAVQIMMSLGGGDRHERKIEEGRRVLSMKTNQPRSGVGRCKGDLSNQKLEQFLSCVVLTWRLVEKSTNAEVLECPLRWFWKKARVRGRVAALNNRYERQSLFIFTERKAYKVPSQTHRYV